jgi:hypothetical protein
MKVDPPDRAGRLGRTLPYMDESQTCSSLEADLPTELLAAEYWPNGTGYTLISGIEYGTCEDFAGCSGGQA